ncbi:hypothetical protein A3B02_01975 [Candidatus Roizmanbacteria bacterium RIFCSPLOWO2_01_FULL_42_14]|uniref:Glycosyltransferase RgtA/B/C/D-like domain-containing protein n=3 Tax=Candidatus Roizmaniibacteriota TaxID=1752723 RepID=A0A1F7K1X2_9BACT|nr:MAG: hypothetical protein A3F32_00030 [Candidatus Roizmanbacteria bacterium RIFCSPHIGHO2_12_FULL_42_10]OGK52488.1 MAG: hypothetical protein A3B02_01975 [Candidatus Roizmanbacteria bacterium RIFCSPLOWO2_01_FULL_42_14]OGK61889.1 MAG: hypothetical protein A3I56_02840 [Candidatus Roizmanbacteria bacterium RIFCSPLOWO2_02_FULL_43_10]
MFDITIFFRWIQTHVTKRDILLMGGLLLLFLLTRLINLTQFPIFTDEGIYIHWSYVAWKDATMRFISLTDGRQPLQTWATIPFLKLFPQDKLLAGRLFSVMTGGIALAGLVSFIWYELGKRAAYTSALLYIITPYFLFYDRTALVDSAINAFVIWMFFISILMARKMRLDIAIILGLVSGLALLGKSSMRLYTGLMFFSFIFVLGSDQKNGLKQGFKDLKEKLFGKNHIRRSLYNFCILYGTVIILATVVYNVQRLSPYMHFIEQKNTTFVLTIPELIAHPFSYFTFNIWSIPYYILSEMGYVVGVIGIIGIGILYKKHRLVSTYLLLWIVLGITMLSFVGKVVYPRYVLPFGGLLLIPAGYLISEIQNKKLLAGVSVAVLASVLYFNYTILFQPARIPFPEIDRGQYLEGWPSGWGIKEIAEYAREKATDKPVYILADGDFGMSGDVLRVHVRDDDQVFVKAYWPLNDENLKENQALLKDHYVFVVYPHCKEANYKDPLSDDMRCMNFEKRRPLKLIQAYKKPGNSAAIYLFELLPAKE